MLFVFFICIGFKVNKVYRPLSGGAFQFYVILKQLESDNAQVGTVGKPTAEIANSREGMQLSFFQLDDPVLCQVRDEILGLDVNNLTPLEALNKLNDIKKIVSGK